MQYQLVSITEHPGYISAVELKPAHDKYIDFMAGQYVELTCPDGSRLPFSIANAPNEDRHVELFIRHLPEDEIACSLIADLRTTEMLEIKGPFGKCVYQNECKKPLLFLAAGTGITQVKSLLEQAIIENDERKMQLFWGIRTAEDCFIPGDLFNWGSALDFHSQLILSGENKKYVHDALTENFHNLVDFQAYVSGPWPMVDATVECLLKLGMQKEYIYSDRFAFVEAAPSAT